MEPNFSSTVHGLSSYAAYPIPSGISQSMEIRFKFVPSTMDQISILLFLGQKGQHDLFSDHMAVSFVKGYVMLTWNLGSGRFTHLLTLVTLSLSKGFHLRSQTNFHYKTHQQTARQLSGTIRTSWQTSMALRG